MKIDGDQPAFPVEYPDPESPGMTLRQWYAGLAMQGALANGWLVPKQDLPDNFDPQNVHACCDIYRKALVIEAFNQAEAMLDEPESGQ